MESKVRGTEISNKSKNENGFAVTFLHVCECSNGVKYWLKQLRAVAHEGMILKLGCSELFLKGLEHCWTRYCSCSFHVLLNEYFENAPYFGVNYKQLTVSGWENHLFNCFMFLE